MKRVKTVEQVARLAMKRKCVQVPRCNWETKHMPAAFLIGMPAQVVLGFIGMGMFIYEVKK